MDKQQLHQLLEQLHAELSQAENVAGEELDLLKKLKTDVQALLERAGDEPSAQQYDTLGVSLQGAVRQFEMSHPTLTLMMGEVLEILSRAGV